MCKIISAVKIQMNYFQSKFVFRGVLVHLANLELISWWVVWMKRAGKMTDTFGGQYEALKFKSLCRGPVFDVHTNYTSIWWFTWCCVAITAQSRRLFATCGQQVSCLSGHIVDYSNKLEANMMPCLFEYIGEVLNRPQAKKRRSCVTARQFNHVSGVWQMQWTTRDSQMDEYTDGQTHFWNPGNKQCNIVYRIIVYHERCKWTQLGIDRERDQEMTKPGFLLTKRTDS